MTPRDRAQAREIVFSWAWSPDNHETAERLAIHKTEAPKLQERIATALAAREAETREACAKIADEELRWSEQSAPSGDIRAGQIGASSRIAAAIRASADTQEVKK